MRWDFPRPKERFRGRLAEGAIQVSSTALGGGPRHLEGGATRLEEGATRSEGGESGDDLPGEVDGGVSAKTGVLRARVRVALLWPQTYMNDAGRSVGPARGSFKLPLERLLVVHDEIDLPFGEVRTRLGGGLAGHNGLKSIKRELGSADFMRVRVGVGRPKSTDPEIVSSYVLGRFRESPEEVGDLIGRACEAVEQVVLSEER